MPEERPFARGEQFMAGPPPTESDRHRYPVPAPCRKASPPPDDPPAPYHITAEGVRS